VFFSDITARNQTEHALELSESRYRRLFETAKDGILILDADTGSIVDVNPFLMELTGFSREELLGKPLWEIGPFKDTAASKASFAELQANGYVRYDDLPLETRDGRRVDVEFASNVYCVDDQTMIQCNIRDITERKRAEATLQKSDKKYRDLFDNAGDAIIIADATTASFWTSTWRRRRCSEEQDTRSSASTGRRFIPPTRVSLRREIQTAYRRRPGHRRGIGRHPERRHGHSSLHQRQGD